LNDPAFMAASTQTSRWLAKWSRLSRIRM
jgi:hypothetical protein